MMNLSLAQVKKFGSEIQSLKTKHEKAIQKADDVIEQGVEATLASATAFGLGICGQGGQGPKLPCVDGR